VLHCALSRLVEDFLLQICGRAAPDLVCHLLLNRGIHLLLLRFGWDDSCCMVIWIRSSSSGYSMVASSSFSRLQIIQKPSDMLQIVADLSVVAISSHAICCLLLY
jgi:hypothetical protein